uniref:ANK_REP_REGION domain-containing protein n=1 Tax=Globodera rostochiensis TaxID=31243 RepID=A0A914HV40_GLORO
MSIPTKSTNGGDITADQEGLGPTLTNSDVSEELRLLRARIAQLERQQTMNSPTSSDGFYLVSKDEIEPNNNDKESMAYPEKEQATFELENKMEEYHNKQQELTEKQNVGHGIDVSESARDSADLLYASIIGKENDVRFLLSKGTRVDRTTDEGFSPLFLAAGEGHLDVCKLLIANGAYTNQKTDDGFTPWLIACGKGHLDIVKLFVENGQDIEAAGSIGCTAILEKKTKLLHGAASEKYNQENGCTGLVCASRAGKLDVVRFLLSKGARVDRTTEKGFSPLFLAANRGHLDVCRELVANGAKVNQAANVGATPWFEACMQGHLDIVKFFVENGQNIEVAGIIGYSTLLKTKEKNFLYAASAKYKQKYGCTGLMYASVNGRVDVVRFLLSIGASVDRTNKHGVTALLWATSSGHLDVCRALVANGAKVNQEKTDDGLSPWLEACALGHLDIVKLFVENGQDIEVANNKGLTGLMYASVKGRVDVVRFLLLKGASTARTDADGKTSRDKAIAKGRVEVVGLLTESANGN